MKILWHSNAPFVGTGYGNQTKLFAPLLKQMGHEIAISCFYGLHGSRLIWDGLPLYPGGADVWGNDVLPAHAADWFGGRAKDGLVLSLVDAWILHSGVMNRLNWAAWVPIDHDPIPPGVLRALRDGQAIPIAMCRFGEKKLREAGFDPLYAPHGVNTTVYTPLDKAQAKQTMGFPPEAFVVGMVAANKGNPSRKSFPEALVAFKRFREAHPEAVLYLHTEQTGINQGVNLVELLQSLCMPREAVFFCDQYRYMAGILPEQHLAAAYNAMDVLLQPSMGEGFGIPIVEAQACGTPVIVTDWTSMPELCGAGWKVGGQRIYTAQASWQMVPDVDEIAGALELAHKHRDDVDLQKQARHFAERYDAKLVAEKYWKPALEQIEQRIRPSELKLVTF